MPLSSEDRAFLHENFGRYGSGWAGGLTMLEKHFEVDVTVSKSRYDIGLTSRAPPRIEFTIEVTRSDGSQSHTGARVPTGASLSSAQLAAVDEILKKEVTLWALGPNGELMGFELANGSESLRYANLRLATVVGEEDSKPPVRQLETRLIDGRAILYYIDKRNFDPIFCVWVDVAKKTVGGGGWFDLPPEIGGGVIERDDLDFIDQAMRKNGDFGVYGNVQAGLYVMAEEMELQIQPTAEGWDISLTPRDGHGHFLEFLVERSGKIDGAMAGHLAPEPDVGDEIEPDE